MLLLTLLTGTFGFSESLMWLCKRPALTEVRDERVPATVQSCPVLVHWKLNASGGAIGSWACFVPCGMDNEVSVSTCRMERWGSLSHLKRAQVTYLICPRQAGDMIWSRGAFSLNVLYRGFLISFCAAPHEAPLLSVLSCASWKLRPKSTKNESVSPKFNYHLPRKWDFLNWQHEHKETLLNYISCFALKNNLWHWADSCSEIIQTWHACGSCSTWPHNPPSSSPADLVELVELATGTKGDLRGVLSWCNQTATSSIMRGWITAGYNRR